MPPKSRNIVVGAVAVPYAMADNDAPPQYIRATVNTRTDILEWERSHARLSEAAYLVGRAIRRHFEARSNQLSSRHPNPDRVSSDASERQKSAICRGLDQALEIEAFKLGLRAMIGEMGERFLSRFLCDRFSFEGYASQIHVPGSSATAVAARFRTMLEELAQDRRMMELLSGRGIDRLKDVIRERQAGRNGPLPRG